MRAGLYIYADNNDNNTGICFTEVFLQSIVLFFRRKGLVKRMQKAIEVEGLSFGYTAEPILDGIGFSIMQGDFAALIGSNGTGKSTLLRLLLGELPPDKGTIRLLGEDISHFRGWSRLGYVPQNAAGSLSGFPANVLEIVRAGLYARIGLLRPIKKEHTLAAMEALEQVGMQDYAREMIGNLSGGQQQRVMLARVLAASPSLMLLDEPTTGVDAVSTTSLYELLARLNKKNGLTVVMVTHDVARAAPYTSRTLCLEHGSMVELKRDQLERELFYKHTHPDGKEVHKEHGYF